MEKIKKCDIINVSYKNGDELMNRKKPENVKKLKDIKEILYNSSEEFGNNIAFTVKHKKGKEETFEDITYKELLNRINQLGTGMFVKGIKDKRIAIMSVNRYEWNLTQLTVLLGGNVLIPIDKDLQMEELKTTLKRGKPDVIVFDEKHLDKINEIKEDEEIKISEYICMDKLEGYTYIYDISELGKKELEKGNKEYINKDINENAMCELIFTSGTTSASKAVMLSHKNLASNIYSMRLTQGIMPTDVNIAILPFNHVYGSTNMIMMLASGAKTVYLDGLKYISKNLKEYGVTVFVGVPLVMDTLYKRITKEIEKKGKTKLIENVRKISNALLKVHIDLRRVLFKEIIDGLGGKLEYIVLGGAPADPKTLKALNDFGITTIQGYGLTETSPVVSSENFECIKYGTVGKPLIGIEVKINNPDKDGIGEIIVKGDNVMLGYYEDEEKTKEVLKDGWFYTGDLGFIDEEGFLHISGRDKNMIVLKNGKKVFPEELEEVVNRLPIVKESMVYGMPVKGDKNDLMVSIKVVYDTEVAKEKYPGLSEEDLRKEVWEQIKEVNKTFPKYKYIKNLILTDEELIKTTTKKVKRSEEMKKIFG